MLIMHFFPLSRENYGCCGNGNIFSQNVAKTYGSQDTFNSKTI